MIMSHTTLGRGSSVGAHHTIHASCACVSDFSSTLHFALFTVSLIFYFILLIFHFIFYVGRFGEKSPVRCREWRVWLFGQKYFCHRLWAQPRWRLPLLRDHWNLPPESSSDTEPSYLCDAELDDETIGMALSSPQFTQEREEPADRRQAYHSLEESLLSSQSLSVGHVITERLVEELSSLSLSIRENPCRDSEKEQIRILLERRKEQILADCRAEIQKHEFQADYDRRSIQKLNGIIDSQRRETDHTHARDEQLRRDQLLLHEQLPEQNREIREAHIKSVNEMEELKRFQGSTFDAIFEKKKKRRSRHYPWTHRQYSGITEWN